MVQRVRKITAIILCLFLTALLAACGGENSATANTVPSSSYSLWIDESYNLVILPASSGGAPSSGSAGSSVSSAAASHAQSQGVYSGGNPITDDPKSVGDISQRATEDPQYPGNKGATSSAPPVVNTLPDVPPPTTSHGSSPAASSKAPSAASSRGTSTASPSNPVSSAMSSNTVTSKAAPSSSAVTSAPSHPSTGWYVDGSGNTYYYYNNAPVTGWQTMSGVRYYFSASGVLSSKVGIDVSEYQGTINWSKVKAAGVDYAMVRVGFRGWGSAGNICLDQKFKDNMNGANAAGVACGVYFYSQAITTAEAVAEANFVLGAVKGFTVKYPVVFDTEYVNESAARTNKAGLTNANRTAIAKAFMDTVQAAGYYPMLYSNTDWLVNHMTMSSLSAYDVWVAQWATQVTYSGAYKMWQYTDAGSVSGISGDVDRDVSLFDYAAYLTQNHWNKL